MTPPASVPALVALTVWRLVVAGVALTGFLTATAEFGGDAWQGLSQLASLVAAVVYLTLAAYPATVGFRRDEPRSSWVRGALLVVLLLVGGSWFALLGGAVDTTWSLLEHLVTPLLVLVDYLVVGRGQREARWWHPLTWLLPPLAYLVFYYAAGLDIYGFLDPSSSAFVPTLAGMLVGVLALGYLLVGYGVLRRGR
ncbi:hypothetical protein ACOACO_16590 [Nocardioides sp. CPCC 205120]|uniref:hypothetical protein n=1 Tax=Nocardioides sp. CPCC 205120 TaxID=3406462 RepID=UPI003B51038A